MYLEDLRTIRVKFSFPRLPVSQNYSVFHKDVLFLKFLVIYKQVVFFLENLLRFSFRINIIDSRPHDSGIAGVKWATGYKEMESQLRCRNYATGTRINKNRLLLKIATWNVSGMNQIGKLATIDAEADKIPIPGLAETHYRQS